MGQKYSLYKHEQRERQTLRHVEDTGISRELQELSRELGFLEEPEETREPQPSRKSRRRTSDAPISPRQERMEERFPAAQLAQPVPPVLAPAPSSRKNKRRKRASVIPEQESDDAVFEAGIMTLQDMIAPTSVEIAKDHICVDGRYIRYITVTGMPRRINAGWIANLTKLKLPMQICVHLSPFDSGTIIRQLEMRLVQIESKRRLNSKEGRLDKTKDNLGAEDIRRTLRGVEQGTVRIFSVSLTIGVHASSLERLDERSHFLQSHLRQLQLSVRDANMQQDSAWRTCTPGMDLLYQRTNLDSGSLAMSLPFTSSAIGTGDGAFLGFSKTDEPMFFNPWSTKKKMPNGNIVVCGESGQGKSYLTKKLALGLMSQGNVDCVVLDRDGDYDSLCEALGPGESQYIRLANGSPINPFDLPFTVDDVHAGETTDLLSEHIDNSLLTFLSMLLSDTTISRHEEAILYQALLKTYERVGITHEAIKHDPETLLRPAPQFVDLAHTLEGMVKNDAFALVERLEKAAYLFKNPTSISLEKPLTVFSIKGLDESQYPLMIYTVKNFLNRNRAQLRYERFLLFLIEEASFMLRHPRGRKYLEESARGVRKFGISQVTISQHPNDFLRDGEVIVANAGTCFFLGMQAAAIEKLQLTPQLQRTLAQAKPGECVCRIGNEYSHFRVVASPEEHKLFTTDPYEQMQVNVQKHTKEKR